MHFSKQTLRALIAIACVSMSANSAQAGFWDWFRGKRTTTPTATASTAAEQPLLRQLPSQQPCLHILNLTKTVKSRNQPNQRLW